MPSTCVAKARVKTVTVKVIQPDAGREFIEVSGANKWLLCELPDNATRLDLQREWRDECRNALRRAGAPEVSLFGDWVTA